MKENQDYQDIELRKNEFGVGEVLVAFPDNSDSFLTFGDFGKHVISTVSSYHMLINKETDKENIAELHKTLYIHLVSAAKCCVWSKISD